MDDKLKVYIYPDNTYFLAEDGGPPIWMSDDYKTYYCDCCSRCGELVIPLYDGDIEHCDNAQCPQR